MDKTWIHYLPIATTLVAMAFSAVLIGHLRRKPGVRYLQWWTLGVIAYGIGTFVESWTTVLGWSEGVFRAWYIAGALLGGAPLAQGTVYLLLKRRTADVLSVVLVAVVAVAAVLVLLTPIDYALVEAHRLSGAVMEWSWVRLFSPFVNLYAFAFLVGGASARMGHVEVLYVTELIGLLLIWWGYAVIVRDRSASVHAAQQVAPAAA
jgi:hypothetical protein